MAVKASALISLIRVDDGAKGDRGPTGATGSPGKDGTSVTITSQAITYQASSSGTTVPTGTWVANPPSVAKGQYLWTRTIVNYSDGKKTTAYSVGYQGTNGVNGQNGSNGKDGATGPAGRGIKSTAITYQAWANGTSTPSGTWVASPPSTTADKPYLWTRTIITYTDNTKSTSYSVGSTLKGVNVGGRNLFRNSSMVGKQLICDAVSLANSVTSAKYEEDGFHLVTPSEGNDNNGVQFVFNDFTSLVKANDTITFSFDTKGEDDDHTSFTKIWMYGNTDAWWTGPCSSGVDFIPTNKFKRVYVTWTLPSDADSFTSKRILFGIHGNRKSDLYIRNLKLELGNIATDWTPAPEDVDADITSANNAASVAQDTANKAMNNAIQAQGTSTDALNKANQAQSSADTASNKAETAITSSKEAQTLATQAQSIANKANSDAYNAMEAIKAQNQVFYADSTGAHIRKAGTNNETRVVADGVEIIADNTKVAEFTKTQGRVSNLVADKFLYVGSHRMEKLTQDGEVGTGFFWTGGTL